MFLLLTTQLFVQFVVKSSSFLTFLVRLSDSERSLRLFHANTKGQTVQNEEQHAELRSIIGGF